MTSPCLILFISFGDFIIFTGPTAIPGEAGAPIKIGNWLLEIWDLSFDVELLLLAKNMGYSINEVPVEWLYVETRRVSPIKDSLEAIDDLIRIRFSDISGKYKSVWIS